MNGIVVYKVVLRFVLSMLMPTLPVNAWIVVCNAHNALFAPSLHRAIVATTNHTNATHQLPTGPDRVADSRAMAQ